MAGAARARAAVEGRDYVVPDDVVALGVPTLAHRIIVSSAAGSVEAGREVVAEIRRYRPRGVTTPAPGWTSAST